MADALAFHIMVAVDFPNLIRQNASQKIRSQLLAGLEALGTGGNANYNTGNDNFQVQAQSI